MMEKKLLETNVDDKEKKIIKYTVTPSDTLAGIAIKFGMTISQLKKLNKMFSSQIIPSQQLDVYQVSSEQRMRSVSDSIEVNDPNFIKNIRKEYDRRYILDQEGLPSLEDKFLLSLTQEKDDILESEAKYFVSNDFPINGKIIATSSFFYFEANLDDQKVQEIGVLKCQFQCSLEHVVDLDVTNAMPTGSGLKNLLITVSEDGGKTTHKYHLLLETALADRHYNHILTSISEESKNHILKKRRKKLLEYIPQLIGHSTILDEDSIIMISSVLSNRYRFSDWPLLYSTQEHGISINTFFNRTRGQGPNICVFKDKNKAVFGYFTGQSWKKEEKSYYGIGDCFVFKLKPEFAVYPWTEKNQFFMENSPPDHIGIGGGNGVAIKIDSDFFNGVSTPCDTFNNQNLASTSEFECLVFECWGFSKYANPIS